MSYQPSNKRIAKNTLALYVRMLFSMIVSLYTSRVVLNTLGVEDYGIFNVVGGVVVMFSFLNSAMASGTQRFLNFEMGNGDRERLQRVFSCSFIIHISIACIIFILAETLGLWFVNTQLVIPQERMAAANWVYQFSVLSAMVTLTQVPYTASIIANEKMTVYGYVGIIEVLLKLLIVFLLVVFTVDKLKLYAVLTFCVSVSVAMIYRIYCKKKFPECRFKKHNDKALYKEMVGFSGWSLFESMSHVFTTQGQNILLNIFFGPAVNAARAVAFSLSGAVQRFVGGFMTAVNPQITKTYAIDEREQCFILIIKSSKFSYFLLYILAAPILINTPYILALWLKNPPEYASIFCQLTILHMLITTVSASLVTGAMATGKIRNYQMIVGGIALLNLPFSYVTLRLGTPATGVYFITIFLSIIILIVRLYMLNRMIGLPIGRYVTEVLVRCWSIFTVTIFPMYYGARHFPNSVGNLLWVTVLCVFVVGVVVFALGLSKNERQYLVSFVRNKFLK